jgi:hypothetical protein
MAMSSGKQTVPSLLSFPSFLLYLSGQSSPEVSNQQRPFSPLAFLLSPLSLISCHPSHSLHVALVALQFFCRQNQQLYSLHRTLIIRAFSCISLLLVSDELTQPSSKSYASLEHVEIHSRPQLSKPLLNPRVTIHGARFYGFRKDANPSKFMLYL